MKKIWFVLSLMAILLFLVSCQKATEEIIEERIEAGSNGEVDVEIESSGPTVNEWCEKGAQWKMSAITDDGNTNANWNIQGLETSGEFAGLCHVVYIIESAEGTVNIDYYFEEGGEKGYMLLETNGQKFKQEWSKSG